MAPKEPWSLSPPSSRLDSPDFSLNDFRTQGENQRKAHRRGDAMPSARRQAWVSVTPYMTDRIATLDEKERRDLRTFLATELERDRVAYGDFPAEAATQVQALLSRLQPGMAQRKKKHRVNPKSFAWPVTPVAVSSAFGHRFHPMTGEYGPHQGVDLVAAMGQTVTTAFPGRVVSAGWSGKHGKSVVVMHDLHWSTRYSHLSIVDVDAGDWVKRGTLIGSVGSTGQSTGPHLHFELLHDGRPIDPEDLLPNPFDGSGPMALVGP